MQTISASLADATSAKLLGVKVGSPLLSMERLTMNKDERPLELLRSVYLPGVFSPQHQSDEASRLGQSHRTSLSRRTKNHGKW